MPNDLREERDFQCPECGCSDLLEVCDAIQYSTISGFRRWGSHNRWYEDYWDSEVESDTVRTIGCQDCGFEVANHRPMYLYEYLEERGWVVTREQRRVIAETQQVSPNWEV